MKGFFMLILTRKIDQWIVLTASNGETIRVVVKEVRGKSVRLGFEAEPDVHIKREELCDTL